MFGFQRAKLITNVLSPLIKRQMSETKRLETIEKSVNKVTLLGRVGIDPQLRGSESTPVVVFSVATNTNYKQSESGEISQKTDWHRISIFKPYLRNTVYQFLKKGHRVYIDGRIMYGEIKDVKGITHITTTIVAEDVIFLGTNQKPETNVDEFEIEDQK